MTATVPMQGACLYVPAVHPGLGPVLRGESVPGLRQVVVCLEDAVGAEDVPAALRRLREVARCPTGPRVFVRPRDAAMLCELLGWRSKKSSIISDAETSVVVIPKAGMGAPPGQVCPPPSTVQSCTSAAVRASTDVTPRGAKPSPAAPAHAPQ